MSVSAEFQVLRLRRVLSFWYLVGLPPCARKQTDQEPMTNYPPEAFSRPLIPLE